MKQLFISRLRFALLSLLMLMLHSAPTAMAAEHTKDTLKTVKTNLKDGKATLLDVREKSEWKQGHLKIAKLVPLSDLRSKSDDAKFLARLKKLAPKDKIVYLHCRSGSRVKIAGDVFKKLGYDVRPLKHGYSALLEAGFEKAGK